MTPCHLVCAAPPTKLSEAEHAYFYLGGELVERIALRAPKEESNWAPT